MMVTASFAAAETNIAILNVQGVVLSSNQANDFKEQLEREFKCAMSEQTREALYAGWSKAVGQARA